MRQSELTYRIELDPHFADLFSVFDKAASQLKKQDVEKIGYRIAQLATEESFDCYSILTALDKGYSSLVSTNKYARFGGEAILTGVDNYLNGYTVINKLMIPLPRVKKEPSSQRYRLDSDSSVQTVSAAKLNQLGQIRTKLEAIFRLEKTVEARGVLGKGVTLGQGWEAVSDFEVDLYRFAINRGNIPTESFAQAAAITTKYGKSLGLSREHIDEVIGHYSKMANWSLDALSGKDEETMKLPERMIALLKSMPKCDLLPDLMTSKRGGFSLEEVLAENNPDRLVIKTLQYLNALPKGDYIWETVIQGVFLQATQKQPFLNAKTYFTDPSLNRKLLIFHKRLTEKLLFPFFRDQLADLGISRGYMHLAQVDKEFDGQFGAFVGRVSDYTLSLLADVIYYTPVYIVGRMYRFGPTPLKHMEERVINISPFTQVAKVFFERRFKGKKVFKPERHIHDMFKERWSSIASYLRKRLVNIPQETKLKLLLDLCLEMYSSSFVDMETKALSDEMTVKLGQFFYEAFNPLVPQMREISALAWSDVKNMPIWPNPAKYHPVEISKHALETEKDLLDRLPFGTIFFVVSNNSQLPVDFSIALDDRSFSIDGQIDPNGRISDLSVDLTGYPQLEALLEFLVIASFHDYLKGGEADTVPKEHIQAADKSTSGAREVIVFDREGITVEPKGREIQGMRGADSGKTAPVTTDYLKKVIIEDAERRGQKIQIIKRHPMTLRGVKDYQTLMEEYDLVRQQIQSCPSWDTVRREGLDARRQILLANLEREREGIYQPNKEKIAKKPPDLDLGEFADHKGETIYARTWVRKHIRGAGADLTDAQKMSLIEKYRILYRGRDAPALLFLQELYELWFGALGDEDTE